MLIGQENIPNFIEQQTKNRPRWIDDARKQNITLKALIKGEGFHNELINKIEHLESKEKAEVRKKYSKDIRDLFSRVTKKRENVFDADGGSENNQIKNETIAKSFKERLQNFKANLSLYQYLEQNYFQLADIDPNGVMLLEYKAKDDDFDLYPTYKSIHDIYNYDSNGQKLEYILFEPIINEKVEIKTWRLIDDIYDYTINEIGGSYTIDEEKTFEHNFGAVPGLILSPKQKIGSELRYSYCNDVLELSKDYARDKSILTIYKFQKGFPIHWRYASKSKPQTGIAKTGGNNTQDVDEKGNLLKRDVSDIHVFPIPKEGQPFLGDKLTGFSSPDLDTWNQYKEDLRDLEIKIEDTFWGTDKTSQVNYKNETATGRYIDVQPISNTLNYYSNVVEYIYNTFANWTLNFTDLIKPKDEIVYHRSFGRRYIIENPDAILDKYQKAKSQGDNNLILDKLLGEYILSKYKSDPTMQALMIKKSKVEPYVHLSIKEVNDYFGAYEANKKVLFQKFWQEVWEERDYATLIEQFEEYNNQNNKIKNGSSKES